MPAYKIEYVLHGEIRSFTHEEAERFLTVNSLDAHLTLKLLHHAFPGVAAFLPERDPDEVKPDKETLGDVMDRHGITKIAYTEDGGAPHEIDRSLLLR